MKDQTIDLTEVMNHVKDNKELRSSLLSDNDNAPGDSQDWVLYELLFGFDGTIAKEDLALRIYLFILPYWNDDGFIAYVFHGIKDPVEENIRAVGRLVGLIENEAKLSSIDINNIDSRTAKHLVENMIS